MIEHQLLENEGLLIITPQDKLQASDFAQIDEEINKYLKQHPMLNGLLIHTKSFPGWKDFAALRAHFKFIKTHHKQIKKVAAVTDSHFMALAPRIVKYFVSAKVQHFTYANKEKALEWLRAA